MGDSWEPRMEKSKARGLGPQLMARGLGPLATGLASLACTSVREWTELDLGLEWGDQLMARGLGPLATGLASLA